MNYYIESVDFVSLKGKTLVEITNDDENIHFVTSTGESFDMYHNQDCCEGVRIESIVGDLKNLLGNELLMVEESSNEENPDYKGEYAESYTWTFYKLATIKGYVDIRWIGESNGYYSESVNTYTGREYSPEEVLQLISKNNLKVKNVFPGKSNEVKEDTGIVQVQVQVEEKEIYKKKKGSRFNI